MCIHTMEAETMSEIIRAESRAIQTQAALPEELYLRFVSFIDAKPATVATYTRALRQMFRYFSGEPQGLRPQAYHRTELYHGNALILRMDGAGRDLSEYRRPHQRR